MGNGTRGYSDLEVWQLSMRSVEFIFDMPRRLPDEQRFGLVSQMQRAAVSIPSNIAEGHAKRSERADSLVVLLPSYPYHYPNLACPFRERQRPIILSTSVATHGDNERARTERADLFE